VGKRTKQATVLDELRDAIRASPLSLNKLGQLTGIDSGRLSRFMRKERDLTGEAVSRIAQALGLSMAPTKKPEWDKPTKAQAETTDLPRRQE
jgi:transcriptional regulator with XRE-family HTH domain